MDLSWLKRFKPRIKTIVFRTDPHLADVAAAPLPARDVLPDWYRKLPAIDGQALSIEDWGHTAKRCLPLLDAMSAGFLLTLPAELRLEISEDGTTVRDKHQMPGLLVGSHAAYQVRGSHWGNRVPLKLLNPWVVKTPPGWSCLFLPPLNRDCPLEIVSGLVDTDRYEKPVTIPFFVKERHNGSILTLEKGTPVCQLVPVRRTNFNVQVRAANAAELEATRTQELNMRSQPAWYRKFVRDR